MREGPDDLRAHRRRAWSATAGRSSSPTSPAGPTSWRSFREIGIEMDPNDPAVADLVERVKAREFEGYAYDGAEASFELLARRALKQVPDYFALSTASGCMDERRLNAWGELVTVSEATVTHRGRRREHDDGRRRQRPGERARHGAAQGAAGALSGRCEDMRLSRLQGAHPDPTGRHRGRHPRADRKRRRAGAPLDHRRRLANIIDASFNALHDGLTWKLYQEGASAGRRPAPAARGRGSRWPATSRCPCPKARSRRSCWSARSWARTSAWPRGRC
ncbi:MAG: hypothetical protein U5L06_12885 [Rhodovibrio sp.]|nr:hypothetical protein [Rhodovibrio sp.]